MAKLLLIDGNSIMNRGYFALPKDLTNSEGLHTNAILGFMNIFFRIYDEEQPTHIVVAFDVHQPTFRHLMYSEYKGTRHSMDDELREQFPVIKDILAAMNITCVEQGGIEADDIIGSYSVLGDNEGMDVTILSGDRDLLQLATERVLVRIPKTKAGKTTIEDYHSKDVFDLYGVTPKEFIEMKGLMGDSSDNIPGVPGIGPKTASKIISEYHSIESAIEHIDEIKPDKARANLDEYREQALFSRDLATIKLDCDLPVDVNSVNVSFADISSDKAKDKLKILQLNSVLKKLGDEPDTKQEITLDITDAGIDEIRAIVNKSVSDHVGLFPVFIDGIMSGAAVAVDGHVYITTDTNIAIYKDILKSGKTICFEDIKRVVSTFDLDMDSKAADISIMAYLVDPLANSYSYDQLALKYMNAELKTEKDLIGKSEITIFSFAEENFREWIGYNAYMLDAMYPVLLKKLQDMDEYKLYTDIEHPLIFVIHDMERYGVGADRGALISFGDELNGRIEELKARIYELAGEEFNINSPKQLGVILFEKMELKGGKKTKSGYSTSADVLEKIRGDHEIIPAILEYRQLTKLVSTYVEGLSQHIGADRRIHSTFNQTVTATGRISSTEPNLQNLPTRTSLGKEIRKVFTPDEGYIFLDADYSQIELRVMASMSGDEALIEAFNSGKDIHAITASQVFDVPIEDVTPDLRRKAKAVNFGIIYGISAFGLGEDLGISNKEAKQYKEKYLETYSGVKTFLDEQIASAKNAGYVKTYYNRIRPIPELKSSNFMQRSFGERVAMNSPIQGTAADIIKIAMINVYKALKNGNYKSRLILQIHDELLIEVYKPELEKIEKILEENMVHAADMKVPLYIDMHTGDSLYDAK